jgi:hypothetical protein
MAHIKQIMEGSGGMNELPMKHNYAKSDDELLKLFLGDDFANPGTLQQRGAYLDVLLQKHNEWRHA